MFFRLLALIISLCCVTAAHADIVWSSPASACTPDDQTIKFNRHAVGSASVTHAAGNIDRITLTCPIPGFSSPDTDWGLLLTYRDSTGTGTSAVVKAQLFRLEYGSSSPELLVTVSSNSSAVTAVNSVDRSFTHTFDFQIFTYWVRIELDRTAATEIAAAHSVALGLSAGSDIRLKHDIALLGRLDNGLGFYRFAYNGSDKLYVGVMAQEVEAIRPDAVVCGRDGYLRVFYDAIGLRMQTYDGWLAEGGIMPHSAMTVTD